VDLQIDQLTTACAEKASELDRLKEELERCDNTRLDLSEQLAILSADKNVADADLKTTRAESSRHKKELEAFMFFFVYFVFFYKYFPYHFLQLLVCRSKTDAKFCL